MPRRSAAGFVLAIGLALGATLFAPGASAAGPLLSLSATTIAVGESFTVSGSLCENRLQPDNPPGVAVYSGANVVQTRASYGNWSVTTSLGSHLGPGTYAVNAVCFRQDGNMDYTTAYITVAGPAPAPQTTRAPLPTPVPAAPTTPATTAPRSTAPAPTSSAPSTATTSATTAAIPSATTSARPVAPTPAAGCADCARLTDDEPLIAGEALTLTYTGFQPGEQVTLVMRSTPVTLGTFTADANGTVTAAVTLPASAEEGTHTLTLSGPVTGNRVVGFSLAAASEEATVAASPEFGGTSLALLVGLGAAALVLLCVGGLVVHRRRAARTRTTDPEPAQATATPIAEPIA
jgi:hypothetical protein